ncbi:protein yellow-like isoform X2 [Cimex lectularius]|uniref:Protein yellow n=1 Tax=Cimex lectularius TaxID=79782 RepID=A0A8I6TDK7_CIMLE|nr:protein yellow-like isoform X2 [Cimex lectularius]
MGDTSLIIIVQAFYLPWVMSMTWLASGRNEGYQPAYQGQLPKGMREYYSWNQVDFQYPSTAARELAISSGAFNPEANLPLGLEVYRGRMFITLPRWKKGVPVTLAWVPLNSNTKSPVLHPYPSWAWHSPGNCQGLTSIFRIAVDECGRLWVMDSGVIDIVTGVKRACPPQILVFDLNNDELIVRYQFPKGQTPEGALFTNIAVDVITCERTFAYASDVFRYGLVVYDLQKNRSWRVENSYFFPEPLHSKYILDGLTFNWNDGIFGLAVSPVERGRRYLYFHPMSSFREFRVDTRILHNETLAKSSPESFMLLGKRKREMGHSSASGMDRNGVLFYNLVTMSGVGCWNSHVGVHNPESHGIVELNNVTLSFPNDLKIDHEVDQSVWVLSNRLHKFIYGKLDQNDINYRVLMAKTSEAVKGTPCEPGYVLPPPKPRMCQEL